MPKGINIFNFVPSTTGIVQTEFIMLVKTDNAGISASDSFIIPTTGVGYNYGVDWGDGNISAGVTGSVQHTYASAGTYTIKISGDFPRIYFNGAGSSDALKLLEIQNWGNIAWGTDVRDSFDGCSNMQLTASDVPDLSSSLVFREFFNGCTAFTGNNSMQNWDVSSMGDARLFFINSSFNTDISGWTTTGINNMQQMFQNTPFNYDLSGWSVNNVTTMYLCFFGCSINQNLGSWNLRTFGVNLLSIFRDSGMSTANYTDTIVGWANYVFVNGGPLNTNMGTQTSMTFDTSRSGGANFANAGAARTYLTTATPTGAGWTISGDTVI